MRNYTNKMIKNAKSEFIKQNFFKYKCDSKTFQQNINHLVLGKHKNKKILSLNDKNTNESNMKTELQMISIFFSLL